MMGTIVVVKRGVHTALVLKSNSTRTPLNMIMLKHCIINDEMAKRSRTGD